MEAHGRFSIIISVFGVRVVSYASTYTRRPSPPGYRQWCKSCVEYCASCYLLFLSFYGHVIITSVLKLVKSWYLFTVIYLILTQGILIEGVLSHYVEF